MAGIDYTSFSHSDGCRFPNDNFPGNGHWNWNRHRATVCIFMHIVNGLVISMLARRFGRWNISEDSSPCRVQIYGRLDCAPVSGRMNDRSKKWLLYFGETKTIWMMILLLLLENKYGEEWNDSARREVKRAPRAVHRQILWFTFVATQGYRRHRYSLDTLGRGRHYTRALRTLSIDFQFPVSIQIDMMRLRWIINNDGIGSIFSRFGQTSNHFDHIRTPSAQFTHARCPDVVGMWFGRNGFKNESHSSHFTCPISFEANEFFAAAASVHLGEMWKIQFWSFAHKKDVHGPSVHLLCPCHATRFFLLQSFRQSARFHCASTCFVPRNSSMKLISLMSNFYVQGTYFNVWWIECVFENVSENCAMNSRESIWRWKSKYRTIQYIKSWCKWCGGRLLYADGGGCLYCAHPKSTNRYTYISSAAVWRLWHSLFIDSFFLWW